MATFASLLSTPLAMVGIVKMRQSIQAAFAAVKTALTKLDTALAPKVTSDATQAIALTAASHFTDANGHLHNEAILYTTNGSAVAASMSKTESDKLPIGTKLWLVQSAGAVTITGSGGVTFTARGAVTGGLTAMAVKVTAALWLVDYGTPHA